MKDKLEIIIKSISEYKDKINSEEATKHYLILPFLKTLGYDVFNPDDLVPEVICDFTNKGDKIDYVLNHNNQPAILIECKTLGTNLINHIGQLAKYFTTSSAKISLLTDGSVYLFFTDLEKTNLMDKIPFLKLDIKNLSDSDVENLSLFTKETFDENKIKDLASKLYYSNIIRNSLLDFFNYPPDKWIKMLCEKELKEALNKYGYIFFRELIKKNIKEVASNLNDYDREEIIDYSQGDFTIEEKEILDVINSFFIPIEPLEGKIDYAKLSNGLIRINYENQYWNICRVKWGPEVKYILLCKNSHANDTTKHSLKSINDIYRLKDKIIKTALETREYCINWRETHK